MVFKDPEKFTRQEKGEGAERCGVSPRTRD
jgi:hypothetical protein